MIYRDDPDLDLVPQRMAAWQLAAERAGLTLRAWLVMMAKEILP